jgi:hypothetical protein
LTEHIDIVTTPGGLDQIHKSLVGRGIRPRGEGLRKKLRDTVHKVNIDVITSGEHAGAHDSPLVYPPPQSDWFSVVSEGVRYATLPALISIKITSGVWGKRPRDLVDAQELIEANRLDESFADALIPEVRAKFADLVQASREEKELPE